MYVCMYCYCMYVCTGAGGINGDGDITKPENLTAFREYVMEHTGHMGVHFVMGDGVSTPYSCLVYQWDPYVCGHLRGFPNAF